MALYNSLVGPGGHGFKVNLLKVQNVVNKKVQMVHVQVQYLILIKLHRGNNGSLKSGASGNAAKAVIVKYYGCMQ